jgi:hypothetical protein
VFACFTPMHGRLVHDHHGLLRDCLTKRINTGNHHTGVDGVFKHLGMQIVVAMHTPSHVDPPILHGRQLDATPRLLPGRGEGGIKSQA